jgi:hypothetical protein
MPRKRSRSTRSDGTSGRRGFLLKLGGGIAVLAGSGAVLIPSESFNLGVVSRDAPFLTADDANATLGIEGYDDGGTVSTFTNNTNSSMDVTLDATEDVEFDLGDDGSWQLVPVTFPLAVGASIDVAVRDGGNAGTDSDIDITANFTEGKIRATRTFAISAASSVTSIDSTVAAAGNSGKYEFQLENTGNSTVTLAEIGVVETTNDNATTVGGKNPDSILENLDTGSSVVNNVLTIGGSREPLTTDVDLDPGSPVSLEFDRFRDGNNKNAAMKGEDVRIDVAFSDGSSRVLDLCVNGNCDF